MISLKKAAAFGFMLGAGKNLIYFFNFDLTEPTSVLIGSSQLSNNYERSTRSMKSVASFSSMEVDRGPYLPVESEQGLNFDYCKEF